MDYIDDIFRQHPDDLIVFSKNNCHLCVSTKNLLESNSAAYFSVNVEDFEEEIMFAIIDALKSLSASNTFPFVFCNKEYISQINLKKKLIFSEKGNTDIDSI